MEQQNTPASQAPPIAPVVPEPVAPAKPTSRRDRIKKENLPRLIAPAVPLPPPEVDEDVAPDDLVLEFYVRIRGREKEVFNQQREVPIWKGASSSGTNRYLATAEIGAQLKHLLQTVQVVMKQFTAEVDAPPAPAPSPMSSALEVMPVSDLNPAFMEEPGAKMPTDVESEP